MRIFIPALATAAWLAAGIATAAEPATPTAPQHQARADRQAMGKRLFQRIDANQDGSISRAEYQAWVDQRFARLDPDGKGSVNAEDIANSPAMHDKAQHGAERLIARYDRSGSGTLDKADFEAREMERFDRLAAGGDSIDQAAFQAGMRHHGKRMRGKGTATPQP
ncbi:MAG: hypothetical protein J0H15_11870 [Xanthomonadales bacterium]|nr:hypothetical protein [Xanthomonadales bacterium]